MSSTIELTKVCEHCGKQFIARKRSTKYCSKRCAEHAYKAAKRNEHVKYEQRKADQQASASVEELYYLSPTQLAKLLGLSRRTIYYYLEEQSIPCVQFKGKTRIRRSDIEKLFDSEHEYIRRVPKEREPITEYYTTKELLEKFGISNSWLFKAAKQHNIPKVTQHGKTYWSKKHCDAIFGKKDSSADEITEWYTVAEIQEKYGMTLPAIYSLVSSVGMPKKKDGKNVLYSKKHFDAAKGVEAPIESEWYSIAEATVKYNMTRDQLYHYIKTYKVKKKMVGKYCYLAKDEVDALFGNIFSPPSI